ncbi:helix-turn-helix domain-containing protein [Neobacillus sp. 114]|uniref:helix-turn-helix domain-containing protein n=1 Tax=Neobacillus sp. 114 TaxID=3048535 RepID=UPI0024C21123|nr:helix-turn-helix domain-containing protein [Neobacillus sp. 114]
MKDSKVDVILHPVRMRIIQQLINQELTAQQLKELLPDIPQASLYRNIKKLADAEVIQVVAEVPIRGTVEKVYSIHQTGMAVSPEEMNNMSKDEHMGFFIKFLANLMGEFERYLNQENIDLIADGVSFRQGTFYLNDEEFREFIKQLTVVYANISQNKPEKGRRSRNIANIFIPGEKME